MNIFNKKKPYDLLDIFSISLEDVFEILELSNEIKILINQKKPLPSLKNNLVLSLFYEVSTRTRISFEISTRKLKGTFINVNNSEISEKKGESILHTMKSLKEMQVNILILRHPQVGMCHFLSEKYPFSIINAGDGAHEHPSQSLIDLFTISNYFNINKPLNVLFIGDCFYSRTFRSNLFLFKKFNFKISIYSPPNLTDPYLKNLSCSIETSIKKALEKANIIYSSRIQVERNSLLKKNLFKNSIYTLSLEEYYSYAKKNSIILHPGPINQDIELSYDIENIQNIKIWNQVKNSIPVRMAILKWIDKKKSFYE